MGNARRQLADGRKPIGVAKLVLRSQAFLGFRRQSLARFHQAEAHGVNFRGKLDDLVPLSDDELARLVDEAISETGASSMRDMGKVMGLVTQRSGGRADGMAASELVRARLSA